MAASLAREDWLTLLSSVFYRSSSIKRALKSALALSSCSLLTSFFPCNESATFSLTVFSAVPLSEVVLLVSQDLCF